MEKPTDTAIRPLHETELPAASALAGRVFAEFEAPEYSPEGIGTFLRFVAPEALAAQHRNEIGRASCRERVSSPV